jgi:hypothetical protein
MPQKETEINTSGLGMRFPQTVLRELRRVELRVKSGVSIVFQQKAKRWLLAADEGGGSLKDLAHYVGYAGIAPDGLAFSLPVHALISNAVHRRVAGDNLVRFEILRAGESCDLAVTHHFFENQQEGLRPVMRRTNLFVGRSGVLTPESKQPLFFDRSGEIIDIPAPLLAGVQALTAAAFCFQCKHAHLIGLPTVDLASFPKDARSSQPREVPAPVFDGSFSSGIPSLGDKSPVVTINLSRSVVEGTPTSEPRNSTATIKQPAAMKSVVPKPKALELVEASSVGGD